jgi:hypothetical protein
MSTEPLPPHAGEPSAEVVELRAQLRQANEHIDRLRIALADNTWAMASRRRKLAARLRHVGARVRHRLQA